MMYTWQYLKYLTEAAHHMTEVVADLEQELKDRGIEVGELPEPDEDQLPKPPIPCMPPWPCTMETAELIQYAKDLPAYIEAVFERTVQHLTIAREKGVRDFRYRIVHMPEPPKPFMPLKRRGDAPGKADPGAT